MIVALLPTQTIEESPESVFDGLEMIEEMSGVNVLKSRTG
jgi:hypothetical protein